MYKYEMHVHTCPCSGGGADIRDHVDTLIKKGYSAYSEEEMRKMLLSRNRKTAWERCFREPWAPITHKRVKGYDFVLSHFTRGEKGNPSVGNLRNDGQKEERA